MIHQPSGWHARPVYRHGDFIQPDQDIEGKSCMIFWLSTGKTFEDIEKDSERDKWMTSHEIKHTALWMRCLIETIPEKNNNLFLVRFCCKDIKSKHIWLSLRKISNALLRKRQKKSRLLIAGIDGHICEICVLNRLTT